MVISPQKRIFLKRCARHGRSCWATKIVSKQKKKKLNCRFCRFEGYLRGRPTTYDLRPATYDLRPTTYDLRISLLSYHAPSPPFRCCASPSIYIFLKGVLGRGVGDPPSGGCGGGTQNPIMATDGGRTDGQNMLIRNISGGSLQNGLKLRGSVIESNSRVQTWGHIPCKNQNWRSYDLFRVDTNSRGADASVMERYRVQVPPPFLFFFLHNSTTHWPWVTIPVATVRPPSRMLKRRR